MIQKALGRIPETTIKQILRQTGNSVRRLAKTLENLRQLREINGDREIEDLVPAATNSLLALPR